MVIITLITGGLSYYLINKALKENAYDYTTEVLYQTKQVTDVLFEEITKIAIDISMNKEVERIFIGARDHHNNYKDMGRIIDMLTNRKDIFGYIDSIYIYDEQRQQIISESGIMSMDMFRDKTFIGDHMLHSSFFNWTPSRQFTPTTHLSYEVISLTMSLPLNSSKNKGMLVININPKPVYKDYININNEKLGNIHIVDMAGSIVFSANPEQLSDITDDFVQMQDESGYIIRRHQGKKKFISYVNGDKGWKYISITPYERVFKNALSVIRMSLTICLICLALGILLSLIVSKKYYNPIRKLITDISKSTNNQYDGTESVNELRYIKGQFDSLCHENQHFKEQFHQNEVRLKEHFIISLLSGRIQELDQIQEQLFYYNVDIDVTGYVVMVMTMKDIEEDKGQVSNNLLRYRIKLLCQQVQSKYTKGIVLDQSVNTFVFIMNLGEIQKDTLHNKCYLVATEMIQQLQEIYALETFFSIGSYYASIVDMNLSYKEAVSVLDYQNLVPGNNILFHGEDRLLQRRSKDIQTFEKQSKELLYSIKKVGTAHHVLQVDPIIEELLHSKSISVQHKYFLLMQLINQIIGIIVEVNGDIDQIFSSNINLYAEFGELETLEEIKTWFNKAINNLRTFILQKQDNKNVELVQQIKEYIQENYHEAITLDMITDYFHISRSHFSKLFKEQMNTTFLAYVNELRIQEASYLLTHTNNGIITIAEKTGYLNKQNIIRAFKKYYNMTPTEYRNQKAV